MSLNLDKQGWKRVTLGEVAAASKDKVDPSDGSVERFVAGEHMETDDLKIHKWGVTGEVDLGPAFHRRFRPGHVLYGSRRTYLRKVAVSDFHGVCANTTFVVESKDEDVLRQEFLPFVMTAEPFHAFAIAKSKGSVNPYVNWSDIERYEVDLPPVDEQKRLADLLWAVEHERRAIDQQALQLAASEAVWTHEILKRLDWSQTLAAVSQADRPLCYGVVQPGVDVDGGVGLIRVLDLESGAPNITRLKRVTSGIDAQYRRSRVQGGDVLLSIVGTIGRCWVVTDEFDGCNIARALARLSPDPGVMRPAFLEWVLSSSSVQEWLAVAAFESARKTLNLSALARVALPRVSVREQDRLLAARGRFLAASAKLHQQSAAAASLQSALLAEVFGAN